MEASTEEKRTKEARLAMLTLDLELAKKTVALDRASNVRAHDVPSHRLEWAKTASPTLIVIVTAITAYLGVNRHTQIVADQELRLKTFEVETTLRYGIIKDYLALPKETTRSRLDMLSFIEQTDNRERVETWAKARRQELERGLTEQSKYYAQQLAVLSRLSKQRFLECRVTAPETVAGDASPYTQRVPVPRDFKEENARKRCRAFADGLCAGRKLTAALCSVDGFEIHEPSASTTAGAILAAHGHRILICKTTAPKTQDLQESDITVSFLVSPGYLEEDARKRCRSFADSQCEDRNLSPERCQLEFDILDPPEPPQSTVPAQPSPGPGA
jgi:hypothetical protein